MLTKSRNLFSAFWYLNWFFRLICYKIFCRYHEHEVDDDVVECETIQEEKCEDVTQGYTTEQKCTKWPREVCTKETKRTLKYSPETDCKKVPRDLCGPSGCVLQPGPEECFDKKETVITEVGLRSVTVTFQNLFWKFY